MHFDLVDAVLERSADRIVTIKQVTAAEEYLQDHFPEFPVLPGVLMIEALVQAARLLLGERAAARGDDPRLVLGGVRAVKYGRFVRPGEALRVEVTLHKDLGDGTYEVKGEGTVVRAGGVGTPAQQGQNGGVAVSGRLLLRPVRLGAPG